ncbi:helix-turn-helix domain-containing protein [Actinomadura coerulea]|uniref:helix-turn-helix domain-containing protein n=1 Tax=Actinomadura coerulea TaxID=46159 RepID=UPI003422FEC4
MGTSLRAVPTSALVNGGLELPDTTRRTFRLDGGRWETPGPDDAESLVERLVRAGVVVRDPLVAEVLRGHRPEVSERTVERRFRAVTGLTRGGVRQIERARKAAGLPAIGEPAADVVAELGYFDESQLARALRSSAGRTAGRTAGQPREGAGGAIALDLDQRLTS